MTLGEAEHYPIHGATGAGGLVLLHPVCPDEQRRRLARPEPAAVRRSEP
ncbi:hypothetical protein SJI45_19225 [Streptomyces sp. S399]|nr:hypothetical protein [Streptomyces sp. S399]WPR52870.1 hypothetical protein SJI45_19225 [Streptomyces sp. S399]